MGFAVSDQLEIVFDTLDSTRKSENLGQNHRIALVVGLGPEERTAQIEGIADRPSGDELERLNWRRTRPTLSSCCRPTIAAGSGSGGPTPPR